MVNSYLYALYIHTRGCSLIRENLWCACHTGREEKNKYDLRVQCTLIFYKSTRPAIIIIPTTHSTAANAVGCTHIIIIILLNSIHYYEATTIVVCLFSQTFSVYSTILYSAYNYTHETSVGFLQ